MEIVTRIGIYIGGLKLRPSQSLSWSIHDKGARHPSQIA
jgi:hypothetical protein